MSRDPDALWMVGILRLLRASASEPGGSRTLEYRFTMSRRDPHLPHATESLKARWQGPR